MSTNELKTVELCDMTKEINESQSDDLVKSFIEIAYNINGSDHIESMACLCNKCVSVRKRTKSNMSSLDKTMCHIDNVFQKK